jgi:DNA-binding NtrC family response regulator
MGDVVALRPIRVLLASRDPRFLGAAGFFLHRNGFAVDTTQKLSRILDLVHRRDPNVVVLDASGREKGVMRIARAVKNSRERVGVLIVSDAAAPIPHRSLDFHPKWTSFEELVRDLERMYFSTSNGDAEAAHPQAALSLLRSYQG